MPNVSKFAMAKAELQACKVASCYLENLNIDINRTRQHPVDMLAGHFYYGKMTLCVIYNYWSFILSNKEILLYLQTKKLVIGRNKLIGLQ